MNESGTKQPARRLRDGALRSDLPVRRSYLMHVGGEAMPAADGKVMDVVDPSTEEVISTVPVASAADVDVAVSAAARGYEEWSRCSWQVRSKALRELANRLEAAATEFAAIDAIDGGISIEGMARDVGNAVESLRYFGGLASELKGATIEAPAGGLNLTIRQPYGVVARIVPFNHPIQFAAGGIAPPLAAGNAVILKPSDSTPLSALHLAELAEGLFPSGTFNVLTGGAETGAALVAHEGIPRIAFTGSVPSGRAVARSAADHLKAVTLELGGKNPLILLPDADVKAAAAAAVEAMNLTRGQGQSCGAPSRALVHQAIADEFISEVRQRLEACEIGDPLLSETEMGPLVSAAHYQRVRGYVDVGRTEGARLITGGNRPAGLEQGYFMAPALFDQVKPDMRIANEEIFGPVLAVIEWTDESQALQLANASPYGLTANIWTNDLARALALGRAVDAGYVWINGRGQRPLGAPFGGFKSSGIGSENSLEELLSYTQIKNLNIMPGASRNG